MSAFRVEVPEQEIEFLPIRAGGPGGQHVNKASTALQLRFDIQASSLPDEIKQRLLALKDQRISRDGVLVIKAQRFRSQEQNRQDALQRLQTLLHSVACPPRPRVPTRPTRASVRKRLDEKKKQSSLKRLRGRVDRHRD